MTSDQLKVVSMMEERGGSFIRALAQAFYAADLQNFLKLKTTFSDYWEYYKQLTEKNG